MTTDHAAATLLDRHARRGAVVSDDITTRARAVLAGLSAIDRVQLARNEVDYPWMYGRHAQSCRRLYTAGAYGIGKRGGYALTDLGREVARLLTEEADHA